MKRNMVIDPAYATSIMIACKVRLEEILPICPKFSKTYSGEIEGTIWWDSNLGKTIELYNMAENILLGSVQEYRMRRFPSCL